MQMEKRPKIKITIIDRKGPKGCHRGHKVGDTFDFDTERGKICPLAMHVLFPEIDILRYGGEVPGQEKGTAVVTCPDADTLTVFKVERIESQQVKLDFNKLLKQIFDYDPDGPNIHHLMAVHEYSVLIAQMENVDEHTLLITELAAYLHDIGVKISKEKYGNSQPQHQEAEGPAIAKNLLEPLGLPAEDVERICFIIGHHHTYKAIDGIDFQILVEADLIVNLMEGYCKRGSIPAMKENIFKTETGKYLLEQMFEKSAR